VFALRAGVATVPFGAPSFGDETMNRRYSVCCLPGGAGHALLGLLGGALLVLAGCAHQQARLQSADEGERDRYEVKTIGDVTTVGNAEPIPAAGVGLVEGLDGTGGEAPPGEYRTMLEDQLRKKGVRNVKEIMSSRNCALVVVTAQVPAGSHKGDLIDVEVTIPPRSRATSLRGGYLHQCVLFGYDYASNLSANYNGSAVALKGPIVAKAEGPILVGFGDGDEAGRVKQGRIWSGARCTIDWPFSLVLNPDQQYARVAAQVADRVNDAFAASPRLAPDTAVAVAHNNVAVTLIVPSQYHLNLPHFLRVVRLVPLRENPDGSGTTTANRRPYRQRLAEDLLDPARTVVAALRLEALGQDSIPALKTGLGSDHPLVRFCAAESLAYLGSPACAEELAKVVEKQPALRAYALTAMASLDEAACRLKLRELVTAPLEDEARYGAFRALRALEDRDQAVQGEYLNESFWLHRVAPNTPPLVHISSTKRAEIVLFGEEPCLKPPFSFLAGEFAVTASEEDQQCTVTHFAPHGGNPSRRRCSVKLAELLRVMADLGASYPEVIDLIRQADSCQCLSCRVRCDALPRVTSVYDLVKAGKARPGDPEGGEQLLNGQDLGATPTLYEAPKRSRLLIHDEGKPTRRPAGDE
jgi:flagellar basal body P-ring protein FlgI